MTTDLREEIASVAEGMAFEILTAKTRTDCLVVADSLRVLASRAERLAQELPESV